MLASAPLYCNALCLIYDYSFHIDHSEQLEERLHDLILLRGEAAEISMWRKHLTTTDRIKVDRRNHELGLWLLDSLPKATMKEVLQTVCREVGTVCIWITALQNGVKDIFVLFYHVLACI